METSTKIAIWAAGIFLIIAVLLFISPFTIVNAGTRAVVLHLGAVDRVLSEGVHYKTPFLETVETFDVSVQKATVETQAASKDLQSVDVKLAVNYELDPNKVGDLWKNFQGEQESRFIDPAIQEAMKAATANYTAEELITKRPAVTDAIQAALSAKLSPYNISVKNVSITNFDFSKTFNEAIEAKVTAEQNALAAQNKLAQVKYEAEQTIETAKAQAESIKIQAQAINSQGGADYVQLQAIKAWDGHLPAQMIPGSTLPFLNLNK